MITNMDNMPEVLDIATLTINVEISANAVLRSATLREGSDKLPYAKLALSDTNGRIIAGYLRGQRDWERVMNSLSNHIGEVVSITAEVTEVYSDVSLRINNVKFDAEASKSMIASFKGDYIDSTGHTNNISRMLHKEILPHVNSDFATLVEASFVSAKLESYANEQLTVGMVGGVLQVIDKTLQAGLAVGVDMQTLAVFYVTIVTYYTLVKEDIANKDIGCMALNSAMFGLLQRMPDPSDSLKKDIAELTRMLTGEVAVVSPHTLTIYNLFQNVRNFTNQLYKIEFLAGTATMEYGGVTLRK